MIPANDARETKHSWSFPAAPSTWEARQDSGATDATNPDNDPEFACAEPPLQNYLLSHFDLEYTCGSNTMMPPKSCR